MRDEEEESRSAAEIEDLLGWRSMQPQVMSAPNVDREMFLHVEILGIMMPVGVCLGRKGTVFAPQPLEPFLINSP